MRIDKVTLNRVLLYLEQSLSNRGKNELKNTLALLTEVYRKFRSSFDRSSNALI